MHTGIPVRNVHNDRLMKEDPKSVRAGEDEKLICNKIVALPLWARRQCPLTPIVNIIGKRQVNELGKLSRQKLRKLV